MTAEDLKSMTVEELRKIVVDGWAVCGLERVAGSYRNGWPLDVFVVDELSNRLEMAQREIETLIIAKGQLFNELVIEKSALKEAQQKIVAQQAAMQSAKDELYLDTKDAGFADSIPWTRVRAAKNKLSDDFSALATHDAELTAKAKAEALEEMREEISSDDDALFVIRRMEFRAAEYRAKAGRKP